MPPNAAELALTLTSCLLQNNLYRSSKSESQIQ